MNTEYVHAKAQKDAKNMKNFLCSFASSREIFIKLNHYILFSLASLFKDSHYVVVVVLNS